MFCCVIVKHQKLMCLQLCIFTVVCNRLVVVVSVDLPCYIASSLSFLLLTEILCS